MFSKSSSTSHIYALSLHDALPICRSATTSTLRPPRSSQISRAARTAVPVLPTPGSSPSRKTRCPAAAERSAEHTSELPPRQYLVCRLLLEQKKVYSLHLQCSPSRL